MPTSSIEVPGFAPYAELLLLTARASILSGLERGTPLEPEVEGCPAPLRESRASFVTLEVERHLQGCLGSLEPIRPLISDVAFNAHGAAFRDPRFEPLKRAKFELLEVKISVLSPLERMNVDSEEALLEQVRPHIDGLLLKYASQRGTFLPAVWQSLPDPREFLTELKVKAGLSPVGWPSGLEVYRYTTEMIA